MKVILAVMCTTWAVVKIRPKKIQACTGFEPMTSCDTADKDVNESDPRRNGHYLSSSENKAWKNFPLFVCLTFHEKYFKITVLFPLTDSGLLYFHYKIRTASYLSARNRDSSFSFNVSTSCKFVPSESFRNATPKAVTSFWSILLWRDHPAQKDRK